MENLTRLNSLSMEFVQLILSQYGLDFSSSSSLPSSSSSGAAFTCAGPGAYNGDILDDPELVWADDQWDAERVEQAMTRLREEQRGPSCPAFWREKYVHRAGTYW